MEGQGPNNSPPSVVASELPSAVQIGRMKFLWRALLISNFALGAYLFVMPKKKQIREQTSNLQEVPPPPPGEIITPVHEEPIFLPPPPEPVKVQQEPVPEDQQRELFKWMLEEKRKVKPQSLKEKQRINEEKAILKQFIRKESIPSI
ncbi:hypothetical protein ACH5RR_006131 [Cinchona calisaya]|uniref:Uncharacterized protein n=1 Tax=Cinchona calisaya TaxID=153742 RepID=A0ABD3AN42_9GENT